MSSRRDPTRSDALLAKARFRFRPLSALALVPVVLAFVPATGYAQPPNNDFAGAQELTGLPASAAGNNIDATREEGEPSHGELATGASVWYRWTAPASAEVTVDVCNADFDSSLAVYAGSAVNALTRVARNDDACGSGGEGSRVTFQAVAGATFNIAVDGFEEGFFTVVVKQVPPPPRSRPGRYAGRTEFPDSKRVQFGLSRNRGRISNFRVSFRLDCFMGGFPSGEFRFRNFTIRSIRVLANGRFSRTASTRIRFPNGVRAVVTVRVTGKLRPQLRISGTLRETARVSDGARCRNFFNPLEWSARHV
jgi:hypothetical protein